MASLPFDTLDFTRKLKAGGFSVQQAETMADALKESALAEIATKRDLNDLKTEMKRDNVDLRTNFDGKLRDLENRLIIKLGAMFAAGIGILFALLKFTA